VAVAEVERVAGRLHARFDAACREYRYRLWSGPPAPLARREVWRIGAGFDQVAMAEAAAMLVGEHDFAAFAGGGEGVPWSEWRQAPRGTRRRVYQSGIHRLDPWWTGQTGQGELVEFRIVADAFLPRMVRTMVGAIVEIGRGARPSSWIAELLAAADRRQAGMTAPPHGLTLWRVGYGEESPPR
jgi:tRNA pseudouridine38-40 synthase